ncbi:hypothetical protein SK128_001904 [Halocaridina rubra]|uniref:HD domain-containing protein n=1 Tax=Halocaridina rubra TaxID=373956 RepID=A0AAN8XUX7_HALRR
MAGDITTAVEDIFSLFSQFGDTNYIGEAVSQEQHALQAARLAEVEGYPVEVILGALFHDIGHLLGLREKKPVMITNGHDFGTNHHEVIGEEYLRGLGFPSGVTSFARRHVDAKRYLVSTDPNYYERLSDASKVTLEHQGGRMTQEEVETFRKDPQFEAILRMRTWDERAKDPNADTRSLQYYKDLCVSYLEEINK